MRDFPLTLHIGYHKTGTTYLQWNVFNSHPEVCYLGRPWINEQVGEFFREFKFTHDVDFSSDYFRTQFHQVVQGASLELGWSQESENDSRVLLVSLESLHSGPEWFGMNLVNMANRLRDVFYPCKIILGIRNQKDYIESNYKEYVVHGGKLGFKRFLYESFSCNYCLLPKLQFDKVIMLYRKLFGDDSVYVYLQERLKSRPTVGLGGLMNFLGVDDSVEFQHRLTYKGLSKTSIDCIRLLNRLVADDYNEQYYNVGVSERWSKTEWTRRRFIRVLRGVERKFSAHINFVKTYWDQEDIDYINTRFQNSNQNLSKIIGVAVKEFGYC
jgi:hypothetical protein